MPLQTAGYPESYQHVSLDSTHALASRPSWHEHGTSLVLPSGKNVSQPVAAGNARAALGRPSIMPPSPRPRAPRLRPCVPARQSIKHTQSLTCLLLSLPSEPGPNLPGIWMCFARCSPPVLGANQPSGTVRKSTHREHVLRRRRARPAAARTLVTDAMHTKTHRGKSERGGDT